MRAQRAPFVPPADGRLEAAQIERYLTVLRRAAVLRRELVDDLAPHLKVPKKHGIRESIGAWKDGAWKDLSAIEDPEECAVEELGFDLEEHRWVTERLEETELLAVEREMRQEVLWGTGDDGRSGPDYSVAEIDEVQLEGLSPEDRAVEENLALVRRYARALASARAAEDATDV
ncbi:MAG: hypothetical protein AAF481_03200 [Acidobacteriota bacterium]